MVIAGTTVLDNRLTGMTFIAYWLTCAALTFLTLLIALLDFRTVRQNSRQEQTELIRDVLAAINETKNKSPGDSEPEEPQQ